MNESITFKGQKVTLKGTLINEGQMAPDCELTGAGLKPIKLSSFKGKVTVLMSVPSLDTDVCNKEAHRFNQEIDKFNGEVNLVCVSMDLPFAQSRWCGAEKVKNIVTLSDYKTKEFGEKYGVLIQELGLLARAVFLIDPTMKIISRFLVTEVTQEPNYEQILEQINQLMTSSRQIS